MLFNSIEFIFFFLPIVLLMFCALRKISDGHYALIFLAAASIFFYGWWDVRYLFLILSSVAFNYIIGSTLQRMPRKTILTLGITVNLIALGWFKYLNFFVDNIEQLSGYNINVATIILPLGISFFTFQQIAYLVDSFRKKVDAHGIVEYLVFVTFFPQLIAGPIVHHKNMMSQFSKQKLRAPYDWSKTASGITIFSIGLFKKVILADQFASYASPIFKMADTGNDISFIESWIAALAYTLQLYFDFSGYSDMAIGLGLLFGIALPINFRSPYKSKSIIEFWQRWHITLSTFLKDYLYIPLGGNRKGSLRRYSNLLITMVIGGIWHGAGWNFMIWGGLHGTYLMINHLWHTVTNDNIRQTTGYRNASWLLTMIAVIVAWVLFRSETLIGAGEVLSSMLQLSEIVIPNKDIWEILGLILLGFIAVLYLPNSMQLCAYQGNEEDCKVLNKKYLALTIVLLTASLYTIVYNHNRITEFIYFQF